MARRKLLALPDGGLNIPELGDTEDQVKAHMVALSHATLSGQLDHAIARELNSIAKTQLRAIQQKNDRGEIDELKKMLDEAKDIEKKGKAREVADRQHVK